MRPDESIDLDVLAELVERQLARGVEGFYCCGSSDEALLLSLKERKAVVRTVMTTVAGRVPVIAHVGTIRTDDVVELARDAEEAGVDAVSMIPPYYYHFTVDEVVAYYETVLGKCGLPVMLYNIPQFTQFAFDKRNAGSLLENPRVIGLKHTAHDMYSLERMRSAYPEKILFNGFDEVYLASLSAGADATVGTTVNLQPELFLRVRSLFEQGEILRAQEVQRQINDVVEELVAHGVFSAAKYLAGYPDLDCGRCRAPFRPLDDDDKNSLDRLGERLHAYIGSG